MLETSFIFTQAWNGNKLCLKNVSMPPTWWLNSRYMPPKIQSIWKAYGLKVQFMRLRKRLDWHFTRSDQRLELNRNVFHCFNEVDTLKELSFWDLVSFFRELVTRKTGHAPNMVTQFEVPAPQASRHMKGRWSEGSNYEIKRKTLLGFYEIISKTWTEQDCVSLF